MLPLWESSKYEHEHLVPASPCYEKTNEAITIKRAIKAPRTTSRLNLRIRFSYACAQSIQPAPAVGRSVAATDRLSLTPLVLTARATRRQRRKLLPQKHVY